MLIDVIRKQIKVIKIGIEMGDVDYLVKESIGSFDTISLTPKKVVCFLSFQDLL